MHESLLRALQTHRSTLCARWETLLRAEPVSSPLGNPDALVYLMDWTLDRLLAEVRQPRVNRRQDRGDLACICPCGRNPLLRYFATAERALVETLFVVGQELAHLGTYAREAGLEELKMQLTAIARSEIESFCAVCQQAQVAPAEGCRRSTRRDAAVNPLPVSGR